MIRAAVARNALSAATGALAHAKSQPLAARLFASKANIENAVNSKKRIRTTLVAAVEQPARRRWKTRPFTVFAPGKPSRSCRPGTVETLLKPENKATLTKV